MIKAQRLAEETKITTPQQQQQQAKGIIGSKKTMLHLIKHCYKVGDTIETQGFVSYIVPQKPSSDSNGRFLEFILDDSISVVECALFLEDWEYEVMTSNSSYYNNNSYLAVGNFVTLVGEYEKQEGFLSAQPKIRVHRLRKVTNIDEIVYLDSDLIRSTRMSAPSLENLKVKNVFKQQVPKQPQLPPDNQSGVSKSEINGLLYMVLHGMFEGAPELNQLRFGVVTLIKQKKITKFLGESGMSKGEMEQELKMAIENFKAHGILDNIPQPEGFYMIKRDMFTKIGVQIVEAIRNKNFHGAQAKEILQDVLKAQKQVVGGVDIIGMEALFFILGKLVSSGVIYRTGDGKFYINS